MRILIVDDEVSRHEFFNNLYQGHEIVHTYNYHEAACALTTEENGFDIIQLDHDLGPGYDGYDIANEIAMLEDNKKPKMVNIYTANSVESKYIKMFLDNRGVNCQIIPFTLYFCC